MERSSRNAAVTRAVISIWETPPGHRHAFPRLRQADPGPSPPPVVQGVAEGEIPPSQVPVEIRGHGRIEAVKGRHQGGLLEPGQRSGGGEGTGQPPLGENPGSHLRLGLRFPHGRVVIQGHGDRLGQGENPAFGSRARSHPVPESRRGQGQSERP